MGNTSRKEPSLSLSLSAIFSTSISLDGDGWPDAEKRGTKKKIRHDSAGSGRRAGDGIRDVINVR